ncbi:iron complex transport system ATP-binding protein [Formosa sp. Hel1_31_208]|uniref:ABC transporter ATP-binding protein n=1 Tax=Formosa sp. Hel1_31_208 TaxID=1798225 RepID=UPI00087B54CF|nr:ABC transporter ATP-binding protein [Formosa sp. Hel1_31_208]SDS64009.1 iron complex transport system ATP-binding protein [Formosa sp. Hel1_31_208]
MTIETNQHIILKTKDLSIGYTSKKETSVISKNINIELNQGELIGLVGANGIGKSTLLRTLTTIQAPIDGSILLNEKTISDYTSRELAQTMSLVLTEQLISKNLSVFELVALGRQPYTNWIGNLTERDINIITLALEQTHLSELKHRKCFELSDGQLQKAMIARALAQDTNLIILDEPTTHLDMYHKAYILKLLQKLAKDTNKTILFSSHEIDLAIQLCDTMVVMAKDKVVSDSPCNLIEQGVFESLFPKDLISFDVKTGSFRVKK